MSVEALSWALNLTSFPDGRPLRGTAKLVLIGIANHADEHGGNSYPKHPTLARYAGVDERNVRRALDELRDGGLVSWTVKTGGARDVPSDLRPNTYRLAMKLSTAPLVVGAGNEGADAPPREGADAPSREGADAPPGRGRTRPLARGRTRPVKNRPVEPSIEPSSSSARDMRDTRASAPVDGDDDDRELSTAAGVTVRAALRTIASREADRRDDISSRSAWIAKRVRSLADLHLDRARQLLATDPTLTPVDLADALEGTQRMRTRPTHVA